jgi:aldehyde dehydrogenase (NAD+)
VGAIGTAAALPRTGYFADNKIVEAGGDRAESVVNPATEAQLALIADAAPADLDAVLTSARAAVDHGAWSRLSPTGRSAALYRLLDVLQSDHRRILDVVVAETGCPISSARGHQVDLPLRHLEYWAEAARRPELVGKAPVITRRPGGTGILGGWVVRREAYGVVAAITPYNFPFLQNVMKLGPALAAGNSMVLKPSPFTPFSAFLLAEAAQKADLPAGALTVVTGGADIGEALCADPRVDLVSFTGSARTGAHIAAHIAHRMVPVVLELGGKSALVVCADADLEVAARVGAQSATFHAGQGCVLTTRHLVDRAVCDEYTERITEAIARVHVGDPTDPGTGMGPLIRSSAVERVACYVAEAQRAGARIVTGGSRGDHPTGYFYEPTVLAGVANSSRVAQEEVFGPVVVVIGTDTDDEAVELANDSSYGLGGHVISRDVVGAFDIACRLQTGSVDINGGPGYTNPDVPFGGYKNSGLGRENGEEGLDQYTQLKTIKYHVG